MRIQIINKSNNDLTSYATSGSSGFDLKSNEDYLLNPGDIAAIGTGIYVSIPNGFEMQIRPRSGIALKNGVTVLNSPGTIDEDYRGEIKVILINHSKSEFKIEKGMKIAQAVICAIFKASWEEVMILDETTRQDGGFGSTGI